MTYTQYHQQLNSLTVEKARIQKEISHLKVQYSEELLEYNGYTVGDPFDCDGIPCIITGVDEICNCFYLQLKNMKKDGTPSEKGVSGGYLRYKLKDKLTNDKEV